MKPRFTPEQHVEVGKRLGDARFVIATLATELANAYPHNSAAVRLAHSATRTLDKLRCELDSVSAREMTAEQWSPLIYYGNP